MWNLRTGSANRLAWSGLLLVFGAAGCGGKTVPDVAAPVIEQQPASQIVPLGLSATFAVVASGAPPLQYQWSENGQTVAGATESTFTTSATTAADASTAFQVTVTNRGGTVQSSLATLTLGARSPKPGDLRFQQVDAPSTVNGYVGALGTSFQGDQTDDFMNSTGAPMSVGSGCYGSIGPFACYWLAQINSLPAGVTGLSISYGHGGYYAQLTAGLASVQDPLTVVTGLNVNQYTDAYGMSYMQTTTGGAFDFVTYTVSVADLPAAIATEGAKSRVVTAITWNGTEVTFLSYGWTGDTTTVYDTTVLAPTYANVDKAATQMAQAGYIITACGGDAGTSALWMVGTKVSGDTTPRPILIIGTGVSAVPILTGGYAIVGLFSQDGAPTWWVGER